MNVPVTSTEPDLTLPQKAARRHRDTLSDAAALDRARARRLASRARTGLMHTMRRCSTGLRRRTSGTVFLIGGADNAARAQALIARSAGAPAVNACDLSIVEAAALLRLADLFRWAKLRPDQSRRGGRDACVCAVRIDGGAELFEVHPCDRARRRAIARRDGEDHAGAR